MGRKPRRGWTSCTTISPRGSPEIARRYLADIVEKAKACRFPPSRDAAGDIGRPRTIVIRRRVMIARHRRGRVDDLEVLRRVQDIAALLRRV